MMSETPRHTVSRLWLYAFAGIVAVVCAAAPARASGPAVETNAPAVFAQSVNGRTPADVFATDLGVYELDTAGGSVRIWQRSDEGIELFIPVGETSFRPFTARQIEIAPAGARPQRFKGVDAAGEGVAFTEPAGMARHPTENRFAVVSGGEYVESRLNKKIPSVQVYEFVETAGADGVLESVEISFAEEFHEVFFTTTNGMEQVLLGYTNIVTVTGTNIVLGVSSNWIYVVSSDPLVTRTNDWNNAELAEHRPPPDLPVFPDEKFLSLVEGFEYPAVIERTWFDGKTNVETRPLLGYVYQVTTNSSFLSTAKDVAFLGDAGLVVPISECGYSEAYNDRPWDTDHWVTNVYNVSGLVVFDAANPSAQGLVFPCATNLPGKIAGIDVDQDTGDIYVTVPDAAAVYRYRAPTPDDASSWLTLADRTVIVPDPDFVAGVPSMPSSDFGFLSNPEDVSFWNPDDGGTPILLVADRANNRVMAFDPNSTWTVTNWLGTGFRARLTDAGLPEDPALGYVLTTAGSSVLTNWYRVETPAFPLFVAESTARSLSKPDGVYGVKSESTLAVAGGAGADVRFFSVDLGGLNSDEILSLALYWPGPAVRGGFPGVSSRDFAVATNEEGVVLALWDAPHANPSATPYFTAMESDIGSNVLVFAVAPSRFDRTYSLSVSAAGGAVDVLSGSATVPAGETRGSFSFSAADGIEFDYTNIVLWATNEAPNGTVIRFPTNEWCDKVAFAETNVYRATPLYEGTIDSSGGYSTNIAIVVANAAPTIVRAIFYGYVIPGDPVWDIPPEIYLYGLGATFSDVAADSPARCLWWTTTDANWAANNLYWAATNHDWAETATAEWEYLESADLYVARGVGMPLPFDYNVPNGPYLGYQGLEPGASWGTTPFVVVCTVIDKDGGASVVTFPQKRGAADYDADWFWSGINDYYGMPSGIEEGTDMSGAEYRARFTGVSGTNVSFVVWVVSGTPANGDRLLLKSATTVTGAWDTIEKEIPAGTLDYSGAGGLAPVNVTPVGSGPVRFYRIFKP